MSPNDNYDYRKLSRNDGGYMPYGNSARGADSGVTAMVSDVMKRVYLKMFFAMLVTAFTSWWCASSTSFITYFATHSWVMWVLFAVQLGLVFWLSARIWKMNPGAATGLFYLYSVLTGVVCAPIFLVYTHASIAKTFFITAAVFGAMSVYGYFTKSDLTSWGKYLIIALFGLIICTIINIFWANSTMEWIISSVGVLIFVGLTAWDTQQIKQMALNAPGVGVSRLATIGALNLYLDFINLFLYLLRFFGNSND